MKVLIAGDICLAGRTASMTMENIKQSLLAVVPYIQGSDYSFVNLECSVSDEISTPITKVGPNIHSDSCLLDSLFTSGFKCVTLANNHFADFGEKALLDSLRRIDVVGLDRVGAGKDLADAERVMYTKMGDKCMAVINCCEHEFTVATESQAGCNPLNPIHQYYSIQEAKKKANYVLVIVHGGSEHYPLPTPRMQEIYRFFVDAGADAVVNHHQHCYSGYEIYQGKPIVYGLGNFFFDVAKAPITWNEGYFVQIDFAEKIKLNINPYMQCKEQPIIRMMDSDERTHFDAKINQLNSIIADREKLQDAFIKLVNKRKSEYMWDFNKHPTKWQRRIQKIKKILGCNKQQYNSIVLSAQKLPLLLSLYNCESHRDIMSIILQQRLENENKVF
ncbi:MAG: CapA family protein [Bacteroidales bacterium]|nr:CapA family protein [Bacteroidales bacterium]